MTKLTMNISDEAIAVLNKITAMRGNSMTDAIHEAIGMYNLLLDETFKGNKILIEDASGDLKKIIIE